MSAQSSIEIIHPLSKTDGLLFGQRYWATFQPSLTDEAEKELERLLGIDKNKGKKPVPPAKPGIPEKKPEAPVKPAPAPSKPEAPAKPGNPDHKSSDKPAVPQKPADKPGVVKPLLPRIITGPSVEMEDKTAAEAPSATIPSAKAPSAKADVLNPAGKDRRPSRRRSLTRALRPMGPSRFLC